MPRPRRLFPFACALLTACSARAPLPAADAQPDPPVTLTTTDVAALAELLRMEDVRALDSALVARHMASEQREVRGRAALAAGRIGDHRATPLLLAALADPHPAVRARAAFALGELGDTSAAVVHALGSVALAPAVAPAVEAIGAIGRLAAPAGRVYLDSLLVRPRVPQAVREEALLAAWRLPRDERTIARTVRWAHDADPELRWRAAYSLARAGGPAAVAPLLDIVTDADERVRAQAVRGLSAPRADSAGLLDRAFAALLAAARDTHPHVRINAIAALPSYRAGPRTPPALAAELARLDAASSATIALHVRLGSDSDANVRIAAAQAVNDSSVTVTLQRIAAGAEPLGLRAAALSALTRVDTATALRIATAWVDSASWIQRMYAARALASVRADAARPLQRLARDEHYLVATEALNAIRAGDSLPQTRPLFIERLAAPHPLERAAAARGLARYVTAADLDVLLHAYDRARRDATPEAATAILRALARLARADVPVARAFFLRFGDAPPTEPAAYRLIVDSIGTPPAGWSPPERTRPQPRPLAFYADIVERYVAPVLAAGGDGAPHAVIRTPHGDIELELASADAPLTVHNFVSLIERGYYVNTRWHRVVPNFVIQDGDPRGDGSGGPGYAIRDEINPLRYLRGVLGMALSGPDTGGSQWFITHSPQPHLDGGYTVFGRVVGGMDVVDRVVQEEPILGMRIVR